MPLSDDTRNIGLVQCHCFWAENCHTGYFWLGERLYQFCFSTGFMFKLRAFTGWMERWCGP